MPIADMIKPLINRWDLILGLGLIAGVLMFLIAAIGWPLWHPQNPPRPIAPPYQHVMAAMGIGLSLASLLIWVLRVKEGEPDSAWVDQISSGAQSCRITVFKRASDPNVSNHIKEIVERSQNPEVTFVGTGLAILQTQDLLVWLLDQIEQGCVSKLTLIMANPDSPAVRMRLVEEQCAEPGPTIGLSGLKNLVAAHLRTIRNSSAYDKHKVKMKLFSNYPTFAMLKVGKRYIAYHYAFAHLGNHGPAICFDDRCESLSEFFDTHLARLEASSMDADDLYPVAEQIGGLRTRNLHGFAVYYIPEGELYEAGSAILGYDLRNQGGGAGRATRFAQYAGGARQFGFHMTVADALWVADPAIIKCVERVVGEIFRSIREHEGEITIAYELVGGFPDGNSISLKCSETEGRLAKLHRKLVEQVYPLALGSNYTLGDAGATRNYCDDSEGNKTRTKMFYAPYVLDCFVPHFTLLSAVPEDKLQSVAAELMQEFPILAGTRGVTISALTVMRKPVGEAQWRMS